MPCGAGGGDPAPRASQAGREEESAQEIRDADALRRRLVERDVRYAMPVCVDVHGVPRTKAVPIEHLDRMLQGSELFTGAALDGLGQGPHDDELAAHPDAGALCVLP